MKIINAKNEQARAFVPYHPAFAKKMQELHLPLCDAWKRSWTFSPEHIPEVRNAMEVVYGESDIKADGKHYNVQLTFQKDVDGPADGLCLYGKCLAFVFPQFKKVMRGAGVCFAKGGCKLRQAKGEQSVVIKKGTVALLYNVPEHLLHREKAPDGVTVKTFEHTAESLRLKLEKEIRENGGAASLIPDISDEAHDKYCRPWLDFLRHNSSGMLCLREDGCPRFHSMFDIITKRWPEGTTIEDAATELENAGWERRLGTDNSFIQFYHVPTQIALIQYLQDETQGLLDEMYGRPALDGGKIPMAEIPSGEAAYIHFGELPKHGFSVNHESKLPEFGVPCYEAAITPDGDCQFTGLNNRLCVKLVYPNGGYLNSGLPVYRVYGDLIGVGSDGEPLLRMTKAERFMGKCLEPETAMDELRAHYERIGKAYSGI